MRTTRFGGLALAALAVAALAACSTDDGGAAAVAVAAKDDACTAGTTSLAAGKTTFSVANEGDQVTEVYVYGPGDRVMSEVENIGPGTKRTMTVDLAAGDYELACKPGQQGDGIRQKLTVTGEGGQALAPADRTVALKALDYRFGDLGGLANVRRDETIEFTMANQGREEHEFEVLKPDGQALGEIGPTKSGGTGAVRLTFEEAGTYTYVCAISDHEARGMKGSFTVA